MITDFALPNPRDAFEAFASGLRRVLPRKKLRQVQARTARWSRRAAVRAGWALRRYDIDVQE